MSLFGHRRTSQARSSTSSGSAVFRGSRLALAAIAFGAAGCTLLVSTSDLHGDGDLLPDASIGDDHEAGASDAGIDVTAPDAEVDADAEVEALPDATAGDAGCFGLGPEAFCDSFDAVTIGPGWQIDTSGASAPTLDSMTSFSAPRSLVSVLDPTATGSWSRLVRSVPEGGNAFRFRFMVRVEGVSSYSELAVLTLEASTTVRRRLIYFVGSDRVLKLNEVREVDNPATGSASVGTLRAGEWDEVDVDGQADGSITVRLNGATRLVRTLTLAKGAFGENAKLDLGLWAATVSTTRTARFDDFASRFDP